MPHRKSSLSKVLSLALSLVVMAVALAVPMVAFADGGANVVVAAPSTDLLGTLVNILVPVISAVALYIAKRAVDAFTQKTGVHVAESQYARLMDIVDQGVHYAAERAAKAGANKIAGSEKLKLATDYANDAIVKWGLDEMARDKLEAMVEARLNLKKTALDKKTI